MDNVIVLVSLGRYRNFPIRILQPLLERVENIRSHSIFFKNYNTNVFSFPTEREEELFIQLITELNPKLVGFSVLSHCVPIARRLTKLIKEHQPSTLVIWGGVHPTISPGDSIDAADMICIGEGEEAITELAVCLRDNKPYQSINNLWVKDGHRIIKNSLRPLIQDLDSLPFPSYKNDSYYFINFDRITKEDSVFSDNYFWIQSSRGCPHSCSYCVNSVLHPLFRNLGSYVRRRSVDNVIKEIKTSLNYPKNKIDCVFFVDEVFVTEEAWINDFEVQYKKEIGLPFQAIYNPNNINSSALEKLVSAGLDTIGFGIETGSDHIRNQIFHRRGKNSEIIALAKKIDNYGVKIKYDLIIDNPYDTEESLKSTIDLLLQLPKPLHFNLYSLQYFPNYPLTKKAVEKGYIQPEAADVNNLIERVAKNWTFVPKLSPRSKKQILLNVIWLIVWNHARNSIVRYAVFRNSRISGFCLNYLNFKAILMGKVFGIGGIACKYPWILRFIKGIKYILKGDFKTIYSKIKKNMKSKGMIPLTE